MSSGKGVWRGILRGGRRLAGLLVLAGFVALFWNLEWRCVAWLAPLAKTQLVPALLAANVAVAGAILLVTLLVGRVYCGVLCPLGLLQDLGNRVGRVIGWIFRRFGAYLITDFTACMVSFGLLMMFWCTLQHVTKIPDRTREE